MTKRKKRCKNRVKKGSANGLCALHQPDPEPASSSKESSDESHSEKEWCDCGEHWVDPEEMWPDFGDCQNCVSENDYLEYMGHGSDSDPDCDPTSGEPDEPAAAPAAEPITADPAPESGTQHCPAEPICETLGCTNPAAENEHYPDSEGGTHWSLCDECYEQDQEEPTFGAP